MFSYPFVDTQQTPAPDTSAEVSFTSNPPIDGQGEFPLGPQEPEVDTSALDISNYSFYVGETRQVNYDSPIAYNGSDEHTVSNDMYVDVEVMVNCPGKTVKLTKRIKFCKQSLAKEASCKDAILNSMATVVEDKQVPETKSQTQRMLELAGINHPKNYVL